MSGIITMETKGSDHKPNEWLWLVFTTESRKLANCFISAAAKPSLATLPLVNQSHADCILSRWIKPDLICLIMRCWKNTHGLINQCFEVYYCILGTTLVLKAVVLSPWESFHRALQGHIDEELIAWANSGFSDVWWLCGLRAVLPTGWRRSCALIQFIMPFVVLPYSNDIPFTTHIMRRKRSFDATNPTIYLDAFSQLHNIPAD